MTLSVPASGSPRGLRAATSHSITVLSPTRRGERLAVGAEGDALNRLPVPFDGR